MHAKAKQKMNKSNNVVGVWCGARGNGGTGELGLVGAECRTLNRKENFYQKPRLHNIMVVTLHSQSRTAVFQQRGGRWGNLQNCRFTGCLSHHTLFVPAGCILSVKKPK